MLNSTLSHKQHLQNKDNNMGYYEKLEEKELKAKQAKEMQDLKDKNKGFTPAVRKLKNQLVEMDSRAVVKQMNNVGGFLRYDPKDARQLQGQLKVRAELMSDSSKFFGTLDHEVIRKSYQYEALNDRQRKTILAQYKWQYEEMEPAEIPAIELDVWVNPLQDIYDTLTEKELTHFTPVHRMSIMLYKELKGRMKQPIYTIDDGSVVTIGYEPSIEEVTLPA